MRHDKPTNRMGYDPAYWRTAKMVAWGSAALFAISVVGFLAVDRWPNTLETIFGVIGLLSLAALGHTWWGMWDNRRYHPRYSARLRDKP